MTDTRVCAALVEQMRWQLPDLFFRAWIVNLSYDGAEWKIIVTRVTFLNETSAKNRPIHPNLALGQNGCFAGRTPGFFPDRMRSGRDWILFFRRGCCLDSVSAFALAFFLFPTKKSSKLATDFWRCDTRAPPRYCTKLIRAMLELLVKARQLEAALCPIHDKAPAICGLTAYK